METRGSNVPATSPADAPIIGLRMPMRSDRRPAATAQSIGKSANSARMRPTVAVEAPSRSAWSVIVTRLPDSTTWLIVPSVTSAASVGLRPK